MTAVLKAIKKPFLITLSLLVICGLAYPLLLTGISQIFFPKQANGSMITINGKTVGSTLIGQDFTDPRFMKCRPSAVDYNTYTDTNGKKATKDGDYAGVGSGSKNYGPTNPDLKKRVEADIATFLKANPTVKKSDIPTDLLTASGSGLDPDISPASAAVQIPALAKATGLSEATLKNIVKDNTTGKFLGIFGTSYVNVLNVNLDISKQLGLLK